MSTLVFLKLGVAPLLILLITLLARKCGPSVAGIAMGIPLLTGPVSIFTAIEQGAAFASHAAVGSLVGQVSICVFCFVYAVAARRHTAWQCAGFGLLAFFAATFIWNQWYWSLSGAILLLATGMALLNCFFPRLPSVLTPHVSPWWELPARMGLAGCFVLLLTVVNTNLGPQLSGLLAAFPVFVLVLVIFTHKQSGRSSAVAMAKGVLLGSPACGVFFSCVAYSLEHFSLLISYGIALLGCISVSGVVLLWRQRLG